MKLITITALILSGLAYATLSSSKGKVQVKEQYIQVTSANSSEIVFMGN